MSLEEGSSSMPDNPFNTEAWGENPEGPGAGEAQKQFNYLGIRNTHPEHALEMVRGQLDFEANWYDHIGAMLLKMSEGEGVEAWVHGVIGIVILIRTTQEGNAGGPPRKQEEEGEPAEYSGGEEGAESQHGPETFTADEVLGRG